jgi:hypothetical protein
MNIGDPVLPPALSHYMRNAEILFLQDVVSKLQKGPSVSSMSFDLQLGALNSFVQFNGLNHIGVRLEGLLSLAVAGDYVTVHIEHGFEVTVSLGPSWTTMTSALRPVDVSTFLVKFIEAQVSG